MFQKKKRVSKKKITKSKLEKTWTMKGLQTAEPRKTSSHSKETGKSPESTEKQELKKTRPATKRRSTSHATR